MINFICFHLDVAPIEKQTLLEAMRSARGYLIDVLTFKIEERKLGPGGRTAVPPGRLQYFHRLVFAELLRLWGCPWPPQ